MKGFLIVFIVFPWLFSSCHGEQENKNEDVLVTKSHSRTGTAATPLGDTAHFDYSDFYELKSNTSYDRFLAGQVYLPSGRVVCADPLYRELAFPQTWAVPKGRYAVYLYISKEGDFSGRVAYAELVVRDEVPDYWRMSLLAEEFLADTPDGELNGMYPVENGLSCFSDYATFKLYEEDVKEFDRLHKNGNYYEDVLEKLFKENKNIPKSSRGGDWIDYKPGRAEGNMIMFASGAGDGLYPRYVGYNQEGTVVKLVTDFIQKEDRDVR